MGDKLWCSYLPVRILKPFFSDQPSGLLRLKRWDRSHIHISPGSSNAFLKFLTLPTLILAEFFKVLYSLFWCSECRLLSFLSLISCFFLNMFWWFIYRWVRTSRKICSAVIYKDQWSIGTKLRSRFRKCVLGLQLVHDFLPWALMSSEEFFLFASLTWVPDRLAWWFGVLT